MTRDDGLGPRPAAPRTRTMTRRRREHELAPAAPTHGLPSGRFHYNCVFTY